MNKDQIEGAVKTIVGQIQESAGKITGNKEQEKKGQITQATGKIEKTLGDVKEVIKDVVKK